MLRFYNTLTRRKEAFKPLRKGLVHIYNCGPTVYMYAHIGNFRTFVFDDLLRRYLEYRGFRVKQLMNITDVGHMTFDDAADGGGEDKIEQAAKREHKDPYEIARFYENAFIEDAKRMNLLEPHARPRATDYIKDMIRLIERLIKRGYAYEAGGNIFFDVKKFEDYGKLSGNPLEKLKTGARLDAHPLKKDPRDFALWLRNPKHIMQWESPWGKGYPGWHIECSVMSMKHLGETVDIHTGGEDNIFPHHECEIAQSEAATGKPFVKYWLHVRHLMVDGEKMSKSKGNFHILRDLIKKGYDTRAIRYVLLSAHYRTRLNFTENGVKEAEETIKRLEEFMQMLREGKDSKKTEKTVARVKKEFEHAMDDDLNISKALASIFDFMREVNKAGGGKEAYKAMLSFDSVLGLGLRS
jgi:cysteinyl-tRNA synthetase